MTNTKFWQVAQRSNRAALITGVGALIVLLALAYASTTLVRFHGEIENLRSNITGLKGEIARLETTRDEQLRQTAAAQNALTGKEAEVASLKTQVLADLGHKQAEAVDSTTLDKSLAARRLADRLASSDRERRAGIKLRYYPADFKRHLNEYAVLSQLGAYGFQLEKGGCQGRFRATQLCLVRSKGAPG